MLALFGNRKASEPPDDAQLLTLLSQIQGGSVSALSQLYSQTVGKVYGLALRITANRADAEEVTCDVYQQVWRAAARFDFNRGSPSQWILVIARNRALDCYRRRQSDPAAQLARIGQPPQAADIPTAEEIAQQFQTGTRVRAALSNLSAVQARLIGLAFFEGLSHREIASRTQLPLGTVKSHLRRALTGLRSELTTTGLPEASRVNGSVSVASEQKMACERGEGCEVPITEVGMPQRQVPPT